MLSISRQKSVGKTGRTSFGIYLIFWYLFQGKNQLVKRGKLVYELFEFLLFISRQKSVSRREKIGVGIYFDFLLFFSRQKSVGKTGKTSL